MYLPMIFSETELQGLYVIEPEGLEDERGFFARVWCENEVRGHGIEAQFVQCNISFNKRKGTLRGMHYQASPHGEAKVVRCTAGSLYDVVIDIRPESETFLQWFSVELTAEDRRLIFIPVGFAHGFQTLSDNTEVFYQMSEFYKPEYGRGIRWNDPLFNIVWPLGNRVISKKDREWKDFDPSKI
jgi:dTDP-4-dehydrorhamnose 3,5-epimerase